MVRQKSHHLYHLIVLCFIALFLLSCAKDNAINELYYSLPLYANTIKDELPEYTPKLIEQDTNNFENLVHGDIMAAQDVEIFDLLKYYDYNYREDVLTTVVIAINRDHSDQVINDFDDLINSNLSVNFPYHINYRRQALAAIAYNLEGENYHLHSAIDFLKALKEKDLLTYYDINTDVLICYDYQAIDYIRRGLNLEIVIPTNGTLSYSLGLVSKNNLVNANKEALLDAGFRLIDGETKDPNYPSLDNYKHAHRIDDYRRFNQEMTNSTKAIRRQVDNTRFLSSADGSESIIFPIVVIIITLFWLASALYRSTSADMRRTMIIVAALIVLWLTIRLTKYNIPYNSLSRYCWYSYYIAMMGLPLCLLYVTVIIDRPSFSKKLPFWFKLAAILYPILLITVFTNDYHLLVFNIYDLKVDEYSYGFMFYVVFAYSIILFLVSFSLLIYKSRLSPKHNAVIFPIILAIFLIVYNLGYILNIPFFKDTDTTIIQCLFSIIFMETVLRTGMIPTNTHYNDLFAYSPISVQIINNQAKVVNTSSNQIKLDKSDIYKLVAEPGISFTKGDDEIIHSHKINGGVAVWHEDISELNRLHKQIENSIEKMEATNNLLSKNNEIRKRKLALDIQTELFNSLEADIKDETNELSSIINNLSTNDNELEIAYITILLCHIKRRCNLFFLNQEDKLINSDELSVYIDELSEFALYADIKALVRIANLGKLDIEVASLCYDFYFSLLKWAIKSSHATLIGHLEMREHNLYFGLLSSEELDGIYFSQNFLDKLKHLKAEVNSRQLEDNREIYLIIKLREVNKDA